ncbi:DNA-binding NarL/FixJ family response regulator [Catalinimonas alkaloidigena]|uniref:response regulator n=1 Tax=Catalinimonas alkaloidigena TaxID=1075417 RepID=UPI002405136A|nr:response regulator transcription factor [Catalinimonas alkaloidigena]MDF9799002.1 DNA-binding NarL/FixJ family response regulator [Catalinimonas alkaloidigena]
MVKNYLLADDHQLFLDGLHSLLAEMEGVKVLGTATSGKKLLDKLRSFPYCDIVIVDLHMADGKGKFVSQVIKENYPHVKVVVLTMNDQLENIREALQAGAKGYILKNTGKTELQIALEKVANGEFYLSQSVSQLLAQNMLRSSAYSPYRSTESTLTEREEEILRMIADEYSNQEIAEQLFISPKTVETHRKNLMKKIGARNSLGIYKYALKHQLVYV